MRTHSLWLLGLAAVISLPVFAVIVTNAQAPGGPDTSQPRVAFKPRITAMADAQLDDKRRQLVATFSGNLPDSAFRTLLQLPPLVEAVMPYTVYLSDQSTLSPRHREILILRTAWLCGNQPLWSFHAERARRAGLSARELHRIAEGPEVGWDGTEANLLRLADQLYRNSSVTDATWKALAASYDLFHLMDAVETVNHFTVLSMLFNSFGIQPDAAPADRLPTDVAYKVTVPPREPPLAAARVEPAAGDGIAVGRTFARHAKLNQARVPRANFINRVSTLQPRYREMLILRIGWDCRAEYEWAQHVGRVGRAREHGLDPVNIAEGPDAKAWDPLERSILRAVDELYRDTFVSDRTWNELSQRFDPALMMTAVFTASSYRATSMSLNALGVQLEPGDERFPKVAASR
jgi:alkylhydroperoxidase family enzyme